MNFLLVNAYSGEIVLMGSEEFINENKGYKNYPEFVIIHEDEYDLYLESRQDAFEAMYC